MEIQFIFSSNLYCALNIVREIYPVYSDGAECKGLNFRDMFDRTHRHLDEVVLE